MCVHDRQLHVNTYVHVSSHTKVTVMYWAVIQKTLCIGLHYFARQSELSLNNNVGQRMHESYRIFRVCST